MHLWPCPLSILERLCRTVDLPAVRKACSVTKRRRWIAARTWILVKASVAFECFWDTLSGRGDQRLLGCNYTSQRMCRTFIEVAALSFPPAYDVSIETRSMLTETRRRTFESSVSFPVFCFLPVSFLAAGFLSVDFLTIGPIGLGRFEIASTRDCPHTESSQISLSVQARDENPIALRLDDPSPVELIANHGRQDHPYRHRRRKSV